MAALDWFESLARLRIRVAALQDAIDEAYAQAGPKGQQLGSIGGTGRGDPLAGIDAMLDADATAELDRARGRLYDRMDYATAVLYGRSGRGGLAKLTSTDDADMLCYHYLQGESWASIGRRYCPESSNLTTWAERHAVRVCRIIDRAGMDALADS